MSTPVIDLFAGPGGLGEGFSSAPGAKNGPAFDVGLSIEKDETAHQTLTLRAFVRAFGEHPPDCYYDFIRGSISRAQLYERPDVQGQLELARRQAVRAELGKTSHEKVDRLIRSALAGRANWVLIGGPPCQAYSLAGRSRRRGADPKAFEADEKHFLYKEYLRVLKEHSPRVFVMENVKGMLSSTHSGELIFEKIMEDLRSPGNGVTYEIVSLVSDKPPAELKPKDFIVASEGYGVPQARHRVILLGIRTDTLLSENRPVLTGAQQVTITQAFRGIPAVRSRLSREPDSAEKWLAALRRTKNRFTHWRHEHRNDIEETVRDSCVEAASREEIGAPFIRTGMGRGALNDFHQWLFDPDLGGVIQHESRSHIAGDLERYMFAASYARVVGTSPRLTDFPPELLPSHANVADDEVPFKDRFRVQVANRPSTTVVSHIAKDGHYYIHPDPSQCRSLTVREAARLQTFPDNYYFEGNRTDQYHQVGNAVPPLLARQIAEIVKTIMFGTDGS